MRLKRPYVASLDQVKISRTATEAIIEYAEPGVWTTHLTLGPKVSGMTDEEILETFNDGLRGTEELCRNYEHVAVEIPIGKPQIEYSPRSGQWVPRGDVLRCYVEDGGPDAQATVQIDDHELSLEEFGRLLTTHAGWGMRIVFVPDDEVHEQPRVEVREAEREAERHGHDK